MRCRGSGARANTKESVCASDLQLDQALCFDENIGQNTKNKTPKSSAVVEPSAEPSTRDAKGGIGTVTYITFGHRCDSSRTDTTSTAVTLRRPANIPYLGCFLGIR